MSFAHKAQFQYARNEGIQKINKTKDAVFAAHKARVISTKERDIFLGLVEVLYSLEKRSYLLDMNVGWND